MATRRASITDLAKALSLSPSTISRALADHKKGPLPEAAGLSTNRPEGVIPPPTAEQLTQHWSAPVAN